MARTIANVLIGYGTLSIAYPVGGALTDVGYTKDGVNLEYDESHYDLMVEESTLPINRALTKENVKFSANLSEASLVNINNAIAGAVLAGSTITIGAGAFKLMKAQFVGTDPAGNARTITIYQCTATGNVKGTFKKEGELFIPITLEILKPAAGNAFNIVDS